MFKVFITDYIRNPEFEQTILGHNSEVICLDEEDELKFPNSIEDADAILVWHASISSNTIGRLKKCKAIVRYGVGFDNIDYKFANKNGITCCNTPDYGIHEVADTTSAMILALIRNIFAYNQLSKSFTSGWQEHTHKNILRTSDYKLGIIGIGRIGTAVALRMKAFGMEIGFYDPYVVSGYEKSLGVKRFETIELLQEFSNIISIHTPLNNETRGMINKDFIEKLNRNTIFINTARGSLVSDLDVLYSGLINNNLAMIGLDVLPDEPPISTEKLIKEWKNEKTNLYTRILINPHTAFYSEQSLLEMRSKAAENIKGILVGSKPKNIIA